MMEDVFTKPFASTVHTIINDSPPSPLYNKQPDSTEQNCPGRVTLFSAQNPVFLDQDFPC